MSYITNLEEVLYVRNLIGGHEYFDTKLDGTVRDFKRVKIEHHMHGFMFFSRLEGVADHYEAKNLAVKSDPFWFSSIYYCNVKVMTFGTAKKLYGEQRLDDLIDSTEYSFYRLKDSRRILYKTYMHTFEFEPREHYGNGPIILPELGCEIID